MHSTQTDKQQQAIHNQSFEYIVTKKCSLCFGRHSKEPVGDKISVPLSIISSNPSQFVQVYSCYC